MRFNKNAHSLSNEGRIYKIIIHIAMIVTCCICLYAFLIVLGISFQSQDEIYKIGYSAIPHKFSLESYKYIFNSPEKIMNSYIVTIITTVSGMIIGLWLSSTIGYVMSRKDYPYKKALSIYVLITMLFNGGMVASYIVMTKYLHLYDNIWVLILPGLMSPWNIMIMKSFFADVPDAVIESAKIEGAGEFQIFTQIVLPMSKPVMAAIGLFIALSYWNNYMQSLLYIETEKLFTLQYTLMKILTDMDFLNSAQAADTGILDMLNGSVPMENARMAMCVIAAGPILLVFPFFQKYFAKGLTVGAVKG